MFLNKGERQSLRINTSFMTNTESFRYLDVKNIPKLMPPKSMSIDKLVQLACIHDRTNKYNTNANSTPIFYISFKHSTSTGSGTKYVLPKTLN